MMHSLQLVSSDLDVDPDGSLQQFQSPWMLEAGRRPHDGVDRSRISLN